MKNTTSSSQDKSVAFGDDGWSQTLLRQCQCNARHAASEVTKKCRTNEDRERLREFALQTLQELQIAEPLVVALSSMEEARSMLMPYSTTFNVEDHENLFHVLESLLIPDPHHSENHACRSARALWSPRRADRLLWAKQAWEHPEVDTKATQQGTELLHVKKDLLAVQDVHTTRHDSRRSLLQWIEKWCDAFEVPTEEWILLLPSRQFLLDRTGANDLLQEIATTRWSWLVEMLREALCEWRLDVMFPSLVHPIIQDQWKSQQNSIAFQCLLFIVRVYCAMKTLQRDSMESPLLLTKVLRCANLLQHHATTVFQKVDWRLLLPQKGPIGPEVVPVTVPMQQKKKIVTQAQNPPLNDSVDTTTMPIQEKATTTICSLTNVSTTPCSSSVNTCITPSLTADASTTPLSSANTLTTPSSPVNADSTPSSSVNADSTVACDSTNRKRPSDDMMEGLGKKGKSSLETSKRIEHPTLPASKETSKPYFALPSLDPYAMAILDQGHKQTQILEMPVEKLDPDTGKTLQTFSTGLLALASITAKSNEEHAFYCTLLGYRMHPEPPIFRGHVYDQFFWRLKGSKAVPKTLQSTETTTLKENATSSSGSSSPCPPSNTKPSVITTTSSQSPNSRSKCSTPSKRYYSEAFTDPFAKKMMQKGWTRRYFLAHPIQKLDETTGRVIKTFPDGRAAFATSSNGQQVNDYFFRAILGQRIHPRTQEYMGHTFKGFFWRLKGSAAMPPLKRIDKTTVQDEGSSMTKEPLPVNTLRVENPSNPVHDKVQASSGISIAMTQANENTTSPVAITSSSFQPPAPYDISDNNAQSNTKIDECDDASASSGSQSVIFVPVQIPDSTSPSDYFDDKGTTEDWDV